MQTSINFPTLVGSSSDHASSITSMDTFEDCQDFLWGDPGMAGSCNWAGSYLKGTGVDTDSVVPQEREREREKENGE